MTRIFHDWEFFEDGHMIRPISVGMVDENGKTYYAIFEDAAYWSHKSKWLKDNVYPHIQHELVIKADTVKSKTQIRLDILDFMSVPEPELWADYGAYDHVLMAQTLGGPMINMPKHVPWFTNDLQTFKMFVSSDNKSNDPFIREMPKQNSATEHHALYDAMHDRDLYNYYREWF